MNSPILSAINKYKRILLLAALVIAFTILRPGIFFTWNNFRNILYSVSLIGIMVCGATFAVLLGGIDRTVSGNAAVSGACCCFLVLRFNSTVNGALIAIAAGLACGLLSGLFHGLVLSRFDIPAFLLTLATNQVLYGIVQYITGNQLINVLDSDVFNFVGTQRILDIPIPVFILLICFIFSYIVLNHTVFGRWIYSVGGNRESSKLSGIPVKKVYIIAYMISGFMGALAGIVLSCMNKQASAMQAMGYENDVLAAIVVGGISMRGGAGTLHGAIYGTLFIATITNGLRLMGVDSIYHDLIKGVIIITAIAIDMYSSYSMSGLQKGNIFKRFSKKSEIKA